MKSYAKTMVLILGLIGTTIPLLKAEKPIKLTIIYKERIVDVTPEKAWEILNSYGDVASYHSGVLTSKPVQNSEIEGSMGCVRECTIDNGNKDITIVEKIIEFKEGEYYKYEVTESDNFPIKKFYNTFGVKTNADGKTVIYVKSEYRLDPGFLTGMAKGKLSKGDRDALIFYKHFMETGEKNGDPKTLRKKYKKA